jgi:putative MATE family efflux protein
MFKLLKDKTFLKEFFRVASPVILTSLVTFIVSFVDNFMVSSVSNEAISGVYAANQVTFIMDIAMFGMLEGAGIFIQQFVGAKDLLHEKAAFRIKIILTVIFLLVFIPIFYLGGPKMIWFYCHSDSEATLIQQEGVTYLNLVILSFIPYSYGFIYTSSLRETGNAKDAILAGIGGLITNIIFNSILIYGFQMGVTGAAIATILARIVEMIMLIVISHHHHLDFCDQAYKNFKLDKNLWKAILKKGVPLFINEIFWVSGMTMISLAYAQRNEVLSALSIVNTMSNIFNIVFQGLSIAIGVMVGSALGANEFEKAIKTNRQIYYLGLIASLVGGILLIITSPYIPYLFQEVSLSQKTLATHLIQIYGMMMWAFCLVTLFYMTLKTGGKTLITFCLDSVLMWIVYVPTSWCLSKLTNLDILYLYLIVQSLDVLKSILGFILVHKRTWVQNITNISSKKELPS